MADHGGYRPDGGDGDEEEEDELDETTYKSSKDAVIFLIEVNESMLAPPPPPPPDSKRVDQDSPVSAALKCAYQLMQQRIISNPSDLMGVLLFGTEKEKFSSNDESISSSWFPHCYLLVDLAVPAAEDVKTLRSLVEHPKEVAELLAPSKTRDVLQDSLWAVNNLFSTKAPNFLSKRLFLVTNDDEPSAGNKTVQDKATRRVRDLYDIGVSIELFPISKPGQAFDRSKFYDEVIITASPTDPDAPMPLSYPIKPSPTDGISLLSSLLSNINSRAVAKRALFSNLPLEIAPGLTVSIKGYIMCKRQEPKRSSYIWQRSEGSNTVQIAIGKTTQMADDTSRTIEKGEIRKAFKFGGEQVLFSLEEVSALRHFGDPGIRIVGFKPLSMLPFWANLKPATFIYPSEEDFVGSTRVFLALWQKLLNDEKMAIAWYVARKNAAPVVAALVAGKEKLGEDGLQAVPGGLWVIHLPYVDDIRQDPETTLVRASDPLVDRMRVVVQQLQLPKAVYNPEKYPNPALQWHYRILQALALDEDIPTQPDDKTKPAYRQIDKRAGAYVIDWGNELEAESKAHFSSAPPQTATLAKRPAKASQEPASKRLKIADGDGGNSEDMVRQAYKKNAVAKLTVAVLKEFCLEKGLGGAGKKQDLVERVEGFLEKKG